MEIIKDTILNKNKTYNDCKFIRCYNDGAYLIDCKWQSGMWQDGDLDGGTFKNGIWERGWRNGIWKSRLWKKEFKLLKK